MTSPEQAQEGQARPARKARVLDVVEYAHDDVITGREHTGLGVVVSTGADGGPAVVRPLADHHVQVDPAKLTPLTAADVVEG